MPHSYHHKTPSLCLSRQFSIFPPLHQTQDKLNEDWDTSDWITEYPQDIPHQQNGCDCGAFTLLFINRLAVCGGAFDFVQADLLQHARVAITCDLLDGGIHATRTHHHNHQHQ